MLVLSSNMAITSTPAGVALVTGGADGFGAAIADRFSREDWKVLILDLNKQKGEEKARSDPNVHYMYGDVTARSTWEEALATVVSEYGRIDVVVNNAGNIAKRKPHSVAVTKSQQVSSQILRYVEESLWPERYLTMIPAYPS